MVVLTTFEDHLEKEVLDDLQAELAVLKVSFERVDFGEICSEATELCLVASRARVEMVAEEIADQDVDPVRTDVALVHGHYHAVQTSGADDFHLLRLNFGQDTEMLVFEVLVAQVATAQAIGDVTPTYRLISDLSPHFVFVSLYPGEEIRDVALRFRRANCSEIVAN